MEKGEGASGSTRSSRDRPAATRGVSRDEQKETGAGVTVTGEQRRAKEPVGQQNHDGNSQAVTLPNGVP